MPKNSPSTTPPTSVSLEILQPADYHALMLRLGGSSWVAYCLEREAVASIEATSENASQYQPRKRTRFTLTPEQAEAYRAAGGRKWLRRELDKEALRLGIPLAPYVPKVDTTEPDLHVEPSPPVGDIPGLPGGRRGPDETPVPPKD